MKRLTYNDLPKYLGDSADEVMKTFAYICDYMITHDGGPSESFYNVCALLTIAAIIQGDK